MVGAKYFLSALDALRQQHTQVLEWRLKAASAWKDLDLVFPWRDGNYAILLSIGIPVKTVQEILGHSSADITLRVYARVLPGMHKEAMNAYRAHMQQARREQG